MALVSGIAVDDRFRCSRQNRLGEPSAAVSAGSPIRRPGHNFGLREQDFAAHHRRGEEHHAHSAQHASQQAVKRKQGAAGADRPEPSVGQVHAAQHAAKGRCAERGAGLGQISVTFLDQIAALFHLGDEIRVLGPNVRQAAEPSIELVDLRLERDAAGGAEICLRGPSLPGSRPQLFPDPFPNAVLLAPDDSHLGMLLGQLAGAGETAQAGFAQALDKTGQTRMTIEQFLRPPPALQADSARPS